MNGGLDLLKLFRKPEKVKPVLCPQCKCASWSLFKDGSIGCQTCQTMTVNLRWGVKPVIPAQVNSDNKL